jgi:type-F conjugative transfer system pilin assembly protein TrbC
MRLISMSSFVLASLLTIYCLGQNTGLKQPQGQSQTMKKDIEERTKQMRDFQELFEKGRKERDEFEKQFSQRLEERAKKIEKSAEEFAKTQKEFDQAIESFERGFISNKEKLKQEFNQKQEEFDELRDQFLQELQKQPIDSNREKEELESLQRHFREEMRLKTQDSHSNGHLHQQVSTAGQCQNCFGKELFTEEPHLLVFISFSVPEATWLSLSQDLERLDGAFVLRGLPNQSFQALAHHLLKLKERGVNAPIQLDPKKFREFNVSHVPSFVVVNDHTHTFDKVSGNVSLQFALDLMSSKGETKEAQTLYKTFKEKA